MRDMVILAWVFAIVGAIFGITVTVIGERQDRELSVGGVRNSTLMDRP